MFGSPVSQRPLAADDPLYVGRPLPERLLRRALDLRLNAAVVGGGGAGKTTLVQRVLNETHIAESSIFRVDCRGLAPGDALRAIAGAYGWSQPDYRWEPKPGMALAFGGLMSVTHNRVLIDPDPNRVDASDIDWLASKIRDHVEPDKIAGGGIEMPAITVIDDPTVATLDSIFGQHRDRLWDLPVQWIVETRKTVASDLALFFEAQIHIDDLGVDDARTLLERRLAAASHTDSALVDAIVAQVPLRPRELISAARDGLLHLDGAEDRFRAQGVLTERSAALGRPHAMLMSELIALGGAYASDEQLLARLGYSRSRVAGLLKELAAHDIVVAQRDGRRVRYLPNENIG